MTTPDALNETLHFFYQRKNADLAVAALKQVLEKTDVSKLSPAVYASFARISELSEAARAGFAALAPLHPKFIEALLQGSRHPHFPRPDPAVRSIHDLDLYWSEFLVTGDTTAVRNIIAFLDARDAVREGLTKWLKDTGQPTLAKFQPLLARCGFPINYATLTVDGPLDCDLQAVLSAKNGLLKFPQLPFALSQDELIAAAMKSSALWSLRANSQQHELVARVCEEEAKRPGGAARSHLAARAGA
jgi:hypothetical protein